MRPLLIGLLGVLACSSSATPADHPQLPHPPGWMPPHTAAPQTFDLPGDGNGCLWDGTVSTLYITDNEHDQIIAWTDAGAFQPAATLPPAPKIGLGGLVRTKDGTFVTTSFGFGTDGGVLATKGVARAVPKLDPVRRRIGIARAPDDTLYVAYFVVGPDKKHTGGVARLDLAGGETDLDIPDLVKPVGIVATDTALYIADQNKSAILSYSLADHAVTTVAKDLPGADLLTRLPGGDFITGAKNGSVYRIDKAGAATAIASGYSQVRGTAYDPAGKRLFVIEHGDAGHHKLHIVPLEP